MEHLGGPLPKEGLAEKLEHDVATTAAGETWILVIVPEADPVAAAGTVTIWTHEGHGEPINEIGWMVLPPFQGQGIGKAAVQTALDRARAEKRWGVLHAFPPVTNEKSNRMCGSFGFELLGAQDFLFRDRPLRCNHWRLHLKEDA